MKNDIFEKMKEIGQRDIHDPEWMKKQGDVLKSHMSKNPLPTQSPLSANLPVISLILSTAVVVGAIIYFSSSDSLNPNIDPTPTNTSLPSTSETVSPSSTGDTTPTPSISHSPTKSPEIVPTPSKSTLPSISQSPKSSPTALVSPPKETRKPINETPSPTRDVNVE